MPVELSKPRLIVCEGPSDAAFFERLISTRNLPEYQVISVDGRVGFETALVALTTARSFGKLSGLLVAADSDLDPDDSFRTIRRQIENVGGLGIPNRPLECARAAGFPAVAVMLIPWHTEIGCLESLLMEAVRAANPELATCVERYVDCTGVGAWSETGLAKLRLQCSISALCRSDPVTPVRYAWSRPETIIELTQPCFNRVAQFLIDFPNLSV